MSIDLAYFNKRRAQILMDLGRAIAEIRINGDVQLARRMIPVIKQREIESEFDTKFKNLFEMACADTPNKASLITELETIRHKIGKVPTKWEMKELSRFDISQYEDEFESWEHLLERLGYDPWYREKNIKLIMSDSEPVKHDPERAIDEQHHRGLEELKDEIHNRLKNEPLMLELFNKIDQKIHETDSYVLQETIKEID